MNNPLVLYDVSAGVAAITLNRADKRNALSRDLIAALTEAFERAGGDGAIRGVILTGAGSVFCAGMDLGELAESLEQATADPSVSEDALRLARLYDLIFRCPRPTIATVNGPALAGGAGLVTVCDLALAAPEARFGYPEVRRGLVAAMVMPHLLRHVGERTARYLLLTGEIIDAAEALRVGLINAVVPLAQLMAHARSWMRALAAGAPQALARTKDLLRQFSRQALSVEQAAEASAAPRLSDEAREGLRAFFAKQPPAWLPPPEEAAKS